MDDIRALAPHYVVMMLLLFLALTILRAAPGEFGFWVEMAVLLAIAVIYRPVVGYLGLAPEIWKRN